jgi:putative membrane protein
MNVPPSCLCAILLVSTACGSRADSATVRSDSAERFDSVAAVAAASMDESAVVGLLDQVNAADSAVGALGAMRATATEVRDFGRMITREHHALRRDASVLARQLGLAPTVPPVPPDAPSDAIRQQLETEPSSAAWDRRYLDYATAMHLSALENAARALAATRRDEVKSYVSTLVPIIQKHLDKAALLAKAIDARARRSS